MTDVTYINNGTKDDAIELMVEMMASLVGIDERYVQYVRFEKRPLIDDSGADLVVKDGATITEGGQREVGVAYSIEFSIWHPKEGKI